MEKHKFSKVIFSVNEPVHDLLSQIEFLWPKPDEGIVFNQTQQKHSRNNGSQSGSNGSSSSDQQAPTICAVTSEECLEFRE
jgi:hypothetical protein